MTVPGYAATWVAGVHRLRDGKHVVTGTAVRQDERQHLFAMRLTPTGQVDPTYGNAGVGIVSDPVWSLQQGSATVDGKAACTCRASRSTRTSSRASPPPAVWTPRSAAPPRFARPSRDGCSTGSCSQTHWSLGTYYPFSYSPNMRIVRMET